MPVITDTREVMPLLFTWLPLLAIKPCYRFVRVPTKSWKLKNILHHLSTDVQEYDRHTVKTNANHLYIL